MFFVLTAPSSQTTRRGRFTIINVEVNVCLTAYQDVTSPEYKTFSHMMAKRVHYFSHLVPTEKMQRKITNLEKCFCSLQTLLLSHPALTLNNEVDWTYLNCLWEFFSVMSLPIFRLRYGTVNSNQSKECHMRTFLICFLILTFLRPAITEP